MTVPVLPLKNLVVFPNIVAQISVTPLRNVSAVDAAVQADKRIFLTTQTTVDTDNPASNQLHPIGTLAEIQDVSRLPDGGRQIKVQGLSRGQIRRFVRVERFFAADISTIVEPAPSTDMRVQALMRAVKSNIDKAVSRGKNISPEIVERIVSAELPGSLADLVAANIHLTSTQAQEALEIIDPGQRLEKINEWLARDIEVLALQKEITDATQGRMNKAQRQSFLREKLNAIESELGYHEETEEMSLYRQRLERLDDAPAAARAEIDKQIRRLEQLGPEAPEASTIRSFLEWSTTLPWNVASPDTHDLQRARELMDEEHYGLEDVKIRVLEYLAVRKLRGPMMSGQTLCFVGPVGVGKTSLGRAVARSLDRRFVRISLGGLRDEIEIRGHRRTYVGALPGRILQAIHHAQTSNPVLVLDEIDKLGTGSGGHAYSALLEAIDPEQNREFIDQYLDVPYDLSKVMFVATANDLAAIPQALLDRMDVIEVTGYTDDEKLEIAKRHLIPRQMEENGIRETSVEWTDEGIVRVIHGYTNEAGLRNLERVISSICRRIALRVAQGASEPHRLADRTIDDYVRRGRF